MGQMVLLVEDHGEDSESEETAHTNWAHIDDHLLCHYWTEFIVIERDQAVGCSQRKNSQFTPGITWCWFITPHNTLR